MAAPGAPAVECEQMQPALPHTNSDLPYVAKLKVTRGIDDDSDGSYRLVEK